MTPVKEIFGNDPSPRPQMVKKFYFLDYFFILLQSCKSFDDKGKVFSIFKELKDKSNLGESKYKKLTTDEEQELSEKQLKRYRYTFEQVINEATNYGLVRDLKSNLLLTDLGVECLLLGEKNKNRFYLKMLGLMEGKYFAFYHLVNLCYDENKLKNGVLIFPIYSPRKLGIDKSNMKTNGDWIDYIKKLKLKLESDTVNFLGKKENLRKPNEILVNKLIEDKILSKERKENFDQKRYNAIISRIRKYWLNYFLKNIYNYTYSFDTFNIWVERGKQLGIIHSTEFYPNFDGRIVYPTSIIVDKNNNKDLVESFVYENGKKLFIHKPNWDVIDNQDSFVKALVDAYYDMRRDKRTHFIRLPDIREKVCYKLRIPSFIFNEFLAKAYFKSIKGEMQVQISLEADRLPSETNAMYLKREPILVNGQYKNIISIDYKK